MPGKVLNHRVPKSHLFYSECRIIYRNLNSSNRNDCKNKTNSLASRQQIRAFLYICAKLYTNHLACDLSPKKKFEFELQLKAFIIKISIFLQSSFCWDAGKKTFTPDMRD